ncbi:MAG TPA: phosphoglucosamine mutase [Candidatus Deferrimicrobium sp.]|nr:phosphoglucosamine mutase [Candidatus Deferrimicrobium sp.]
MKEKTLIASTSGVRGIIGAGLDPLVAIGYAAAFGTMLRKGSVVVGHDSRPSGDMITRAVISGMVSTGRDVIDVGIVPTPTVEIAVAELSASGGICVTASHNPAQWNALKFFNREGEFITPAQFKKLQAIYNSGRFDFRPFFELGEIETQSHWIERHVQLILAAPSLKLPAIKRRRFRVVVDAINGAGSVALPLLLRKMGVTVVEINCRGDGDFVHEPEPVPANLGQVSKAVRRHKADLGLACDPDADRLALVDEIGHPIGEELTLAIAVKQVLKNASGPVVINLSTSNVTADVARLSGSKVYYSPVGEANVVHMMRRRQAVIGGEGNGGVIYPAVHTGRDALVGAALILSCLAEEKTSLAGLVRTLPKYYIKKTKAVLPENFSNRLRRFERETAKLLGATRCDRRDGRRFDFRQGWLQIRASNTEPIFRLIVETVDKDLTDRLCKQIEGYFT